MNKEKLLQILLELKSEYKHYDNFLIRIVEALLEDAIEDIEKEVKVKK